MEEGGEEGWYGGERVVSIVVVWRGGGREGRRGGIVGRG